MLCGPDNIPHESPDIRLLLEGFDEINNVEDEQYCIDIGGKLLHLNT